MIFIIFQFKSFLLTTGNHFWLKKNVTIVLWKVTKLFPKTLGYYNPQPTRCSRIWLVYDKIKKNENKFRNKLIKFDCNFNLISNIERLIIKLHFKILSTKILMLSNKIKIGLDVINIYNKRDEFVKKPILTFNISIKFKYITPKNVFFLQLYYSADLTFINFV